MNSYQILYKKNVVLAVNLGNANASEEIKSLNEQGFKIFSRIIQAVSEDRAVAIYRAENQSTHSEHDVSIKNVFLFKTNRLRRLPYLGYSFSSFIVAALSVLMLNQQASNSDGGGALFLLFPILIALFWFSIGLSVARWKNCGHKGWYYAVALVVTMLIDTFLMGVASTVLWLYLLFNPQSKNI
ncbi:hypothetical protein BCU83_04635 [Vibrio breoganii]|uniref:DUF805 domain-containing protein n=1 Tax=Vibrio breoganii TaxID=553239 RepID=UPI000C851347|nr:DUF805 domain-containing protein [Vibrio breoganii]PMG84558.1 hypothetical protein BCU83_04635 [Vibrio breoganii]